MTDSICASINNKLNEGLVAVTNSLNGAYTSVNTYLSNPQNPVGQAYQKVRSEINTLLDQIMRSNIARLKQERASINLKDVPYEFKPGKVIPQFYKPVWLSNDQVCALEVSKNGLTEGKKWGIYEGCEWGIAKNMRDSCMIFHRVVSAHGQATGPFHWLTERVVAMDYANSRGEIEIYVRA